MMEGGLPEGYQATPEQQQQMNEQSKLMATAVAGQVYQTAKVEATKIKNVVLGLKDGPASIKVLSYIGGLLLVVISLFAFMGKVFALHPIDALVHLYMFLFGLAVLILESRIPLVPSNVIESLHKYAAFTTVVWGRGAFFFFVGTLALAQWQFMDILLGIYLMALGAGMVYWGQEAMKNLDSLMMQMKDPKVVQSMFTKFDRNRNGVLETQELGNLLAALGAELRPAEVEAAVIIMDQDNDGKISLEEFQNWWSRLESVPLMV